MLTNGIIGCLTTIFLITPLPGNETLDEKTLLEAVRRDPYVQQLREALRESAGERSQLAGAYANPSLNFERESITEQTVDIDETTLALSWRLDKIGQRQDYLALAEQEQAKSEAELAEFMARQTMRARLAFHELFFLQRQSRALVEAEAEIKRRQADLGKKISAGETPPIEAARLRLVSTRLAARNQANLNRQITAWSEIAPWVKGNQDGIPMLTSTFLPAQVEKRITDHPTLVRMKLAEEVAVRNADILSRRWREIELSAGLKRFETNGFEDTGFIAGFSLPLPVRKANGEARLQAQLTAVRTRAEGERFEKQRLTRIKALKHQFRENRDAFQEQEHWQKEASELVRISTLAYVQGEADLQIVLEALNHQLETRLSRMHNAKLVWLAHVEIEFWEGRHD